MPNASQRELCEEIKLANKRGLFVNYSPSSLSFRFVCANLFLANSAKSTNFSLRLFLTFVLRFIYSCMSFLCKIDGFY